LPSLVVPSAKSTITSPWASRRATAALTSAVWLRRCRSMKTLRWSLENGPKTGHSAISDFAMKEIGLRLPMTAMSSQETWFARTSVGTSAGGFPRTRTRTPNSLRKRRWNHIGK
jgi:hypothetical protein